MKLWTIINNKLVIILTMVSSHNLYATTKHFYIHFLFVLSWNTSLFVTISHLLPSKHLILLHSNLIFLESSWIAFALFILLPMVFMLSLTFSMFWLTLPMLGLAYPTHTVINVMLKAIHLPFEALLSCSFLLFHLLSGSTWTSNAPLF